ncbi:MAG: purine-nucleoside phosphorylase [Pirellulales bacterium]|nr:purine-nucleoside phosphorylase [Pirellulales bacterium]
MLHLAKQIEETANAICRRRECRPRVGIILGSGLGKLANRIENPTGIPYNDLPHFPSSTAIGHEGRLVLGMLAGMPVTVLQGRFHLYEGYSAARVTFPVRVFRALGVEWLIVTNAAGGLNPHYARSEIVVLDDHINRMADNPLIGINDNRLGPRFPDMSKPYDPLLVDQALAIARRNDFVAHRGIYVGMTGPTYETRAEYRFLRQIGGDVVGMSTVPEVIVAAHIGMRVLGLSSVTNVCQPESLGATTADEVIQAAAASEERIACIVLGILEWLAEQEDPVQGDGSFEPT